MIADSLLNPDACHLCNERCDDAVCCAGGHLFCRECLYKNILAQKKLLKKQRKQYEAQQAEAAANGDAAVSARERAEKLRQAEQSLLPQTESAKEQRQADADSRTSAKRKQLEDLTSDETRKKKLKKNAYWLPDSQGTHVEEVLKVPPKHPSCPASASCASKSLKLASVRDVVLSTTGGEGETGCPMCSQQCTKSTQLVVLACGHAHCVGCYEKLRGASASAGQLQCFVCEKMGPDADAIKLFRPGTGFAGSGAQLALATKTPNGFN